MKQFLLVSQQQPAKMPRPSTKGKYSFGDVEPRVSIHSVPFYLGIAVVAVLGGLFGIVYNIDGILPAPLNVADEVSQD